MDREGSTEPTVIPETPCHSPQSETEKNSSQSETEEHSPQSVSRELSLTPEIKDMTFEQFIAKYNRYTDPSD